MYCESTLLHFLHGFLIFGLRCIRWILNVIVSFVDISIYSFLWISTNNAFREYQLTYRQFSLVINWYDLRVYHFTLFSWDTNIRYSICGHQYLMYVVFSVGEWGIKHFIYFSWVPINVIRTISIGYQFTSFIVGWSYIKPRWNVNCNGNISGKKTLRFQTHWMPVAFLNRGINLLLIFLDMYVLLAKHTVEM